MTQEIRELKKQLKSVPSSPRAGGDNAIIEELRQNLEKETIERLLKEDDLAKVKKEFEELKKHVEEDRNNNKEMKDLTSRLRAVEDAKVFF